MENSSTVFAEAEHRTYWPMARAANADLLVESTPRVNLLLTGTDDLIQLALLHFIPTLCGAVEIWTPNSALQLPPPTQAGTLILRGVEALPAFDQFRLLKWLEEPNLRTRVISTTSAQLRACVEEGSFDRALYFRLNVACMDLMA
ncbi:MAG TPA: sigma 54-interacting transcriptional regulator [Vicinamibacterales bacterium]|nr:sigma 54-interacting transcriptional regulator [Vicinamibacterales bacterium]